MTGSQRPWRIALVSFVVLTIELAFIRQLPAEVRAISYFTNLVLMASFFGLGLGCVVRWRPALQWLLPGGLLVVLALTLLGRGVVEYGRVDSVHFWLQGAGAAAQARPFPVLAVALLAFVASAMPFIALGQRLALEMDRQARLVAYAWDIAGSLLGVISFTAAAAAGLPPWVFILATMPVWALVFVESWTKRAVFVVSGLAFLACAQSPLTSVWSPYYLVQYLTNEVGTRVYINSSFHQQLVDFTATGTPLVQAVLREKWGRPYALYRSMHGGQSPRRVLILGAGTGNDVVMALEQGAEDVTAVEIDSRILDLGRRLNKSRPYDDPRVHAVVDDARHFLGTSREKFDLVIFATLDSQALLSGHANLRLENYVYTRESLLDARERIEQRGLVVVFYSVFKPWLLNRIFATFRSAFGEQSMIHVDDDDYLFNTHLLGTKGDPGLRSDPATVARLGSGPLSTDDWPFIYLERRTIAPLYLQIAGTIAVGILLTLAFVLRSHPAGTFKPHFLLLGLGFTLVESSAVVRLALLFGATWVVNAVVFASVLLTIFVTNLVVLRGRAPSLRMSWMGLLVGLGVNYLTPVSELIVLPGAARVVVVGLLIGWPVACASFCFSHLFSQETSTGFALGTNLVGAMAGGLVEYASMLLGMRAIWLVALVIYGGAWVSSRVKRD